MFIKHDVGLAKDRRFGYFAAVGPVFGAATVAVGLPLALATFFWKVLFALREGCQAGAVGAAKPSVIAAMKLPLVSEWHIIDNVDVAADVRFILRKTSAVYG